MVCNVKMRLRCEMAYTYQRSMQVLLLKTAVRLAYNVNKYVSLTVENRQQTFVFRRIALLMPLFIKLFYLKNTCRYEYFGWCLGVF